METQDGFILGIYNYCDRWCERCTLASRCRVYAGQLQLALDAPAASAQSRPELSPLLRSLGAVAALFEEACPDRPPTADPDAGDLPEVEADGAASEAPLPRPELDAADLALQQRVQALAVRGWQWLAPESRAAEPMVKDAAEALQHFATFLPPKVNRALTGRTAYEADGMHSDALGSAKAALLALDRLGDTWLRLAEHGVVSVVEAGPVLAELQSVTVALEQRFPRARDFVRPGFDEPEAVAMLEWRERG